MSINVGTVKKIDTVEIKKSTQNYHYDRYKKKDLILHPTLLSYPNKMDATEKSRERVIDCIIAPSREIDVKRDFLLSPGVKISQIGDTFLCLALYQKKTLDVKTGRVEEQTPKLMKEITLRFNSRAERNDWTKLIVAEANENYLRNVITGTNCDEEFIKKAYREIWHRILIGDKFDAARKAFIHVPGTPGHQFVCNVVAKILEWMEHLLEVNRFKDEHHEIFVTLFCSALCSPPFRTFMFLFVPTPGLIEDYLHAYCFLPHETEELRSEVVNQSQTTSGTNSPVPPHTPISTKSAKSLFSSSTSSYSLNSPSPNQGNSSPLGEIDDDSTTESKAADDPTENGRSSIFALPPEKRKLRGAIELVYHITRTMINDQWCSNSCYFMRIVNHPLGELVIQQLHQHEKQVTTFKSLMMLISQNPTQAEQELSNMREFDSNLLSSELEWFTTDHVLDAVESLNWNTLNCTLKEPPYLSFRLISRIIAIVIDDHQISQVVSLLKLMPKDYFAKTFTSEFTQNPVGDHFRNLMNYCKFREMWKIFSNISSLNVETHPENKAFSDEIHRGLWGLISRSKCPHLSHMFLPQAFVLERKRLPWSQYKFKDSIHGELISRLSRKEPYLLNVFTVDGGVNVSSDEIDDDYLKVHQGLIGLCNLSERIMKWISCLKRGHTSFLEEDAEIYVVLLQTCAENYVFRALLWLFLPTDDMVEEYALEHNVNSFSQKAILTMVELISEKALKLKETAFLSFLWMVDHPYRRYIEGSETTLHQANGLSTQAPLFEPYWENESKWMFQVQTSFQAQAWSLNWTELKTCLLNTTSIAFKILLLRYQENPTFSNIFTLCDGLPLYVLLENFQTCFTYQTLYSLDLEEDHSIIEPNRYFLSLLNAIVVQEYWKIMKKVEGDLHSAFSFEFQVRLWQILEQSRSMQSEKAHFPNIISLLKPAQLTLSPNKRIFVDVLPAYFYEKFHNHNSIDLHKKKILFEAIQMSFLKGSESGAITNHNDDLQLELDINNWLWYFKVIYKWISVFVGCDIFTTDYIDAFLHLLDAAISSSAFRAFLVCVRPHYGMIHSYMSRNVIDINAEAASKFIKEFSSLNNKDHFEKLAYYFHLRDHPGVTHTNVDTVKKYVMEEISWSKECNWLQSIYHENSFAIFGLEDFDFIHENPSYLIYHQFMKNSSTFHEDESILQLMDSISALPSYIFRDEFTANVNYLPAFQLRQYGLMFTKECRAHFVDLQLFFNLLGMWDMFSSSLLDRHGEHTSVPVIITELWYQITYQNNKHLKAIFLPDESQVVSKTKDDYFMSMVHRRALQVIREERCPILVKGIYRSVKDIWDANNTFVQDMVMEEFYLLQNRIFKWASIIYPGMSDDKKYERCVFFVSLLSACSQDAVLRALVLIFLPSSTFLDQYLGESNSVTDARMMVDIIAKQLKKQENREMRMFVIPCIHPIKNVGHSNEVCPTWTEESTWITKYCNAIMLRETLIDWNMLQLAFRYPPYLTWIMITRVFTPDERLIALKQLPAKMLTSTFCVHHFDVQATTPSPRAHFISLCISEGQHIFLWMLRQRLINDFFMSQLLEFAFANDQSPKILQAHLLLKQLIFEEVEHEVILKADALKLVPNLPQILTSVLYRVSNIQTFRRDESTLCKLFALILRLEECKQISKLNTFITASEWMQNDHNGIVQYFDTVRELNFVRWLAIKCHKHMGLFGQEKNTDADQDIVQVPATKLVVQSYISGFFKLCIKFSHESIFKAFVDNLGTGRLFFTQFTKPSEHLRTTIIRDLIKLLVINNYDHEMMLTALNEGSLLYDNDHMSADALRALGIRYHMNSTSTCNLPEHVFTNLLVVGMYLHEVKHLKQQLEAIIDELLKDEDRLEMFDKILNWVITLKIQKDFNLQSSSKYSVRRFQWKYCKTFTNVTIRHLFECACHAAAAIQSLRGSGDLQSSGYRILERLFLHYISKSKPTLWKEVFPQAKTIAYFIKYVDREDLKLAYKKFLEINDGNRNFQRHIEKVKKIFKKPIVSSSQLVELTTASADSNIQVESFLNDLLAKGNDYDEGHDLRIVYKMVAKWMKISQQTVRIPLPPRNAQLITLLTCASWAKRLLLNDDKSMGKALIAQVGTGEGKSLIIAMMAIYFAVILGKRVHVLENNLGLLEKDYYGLEEFYKEFGIERRHGNGSSIEMMDYTRTTIEALSLTDCRGEFCEYGVTYCLRGNLERYYQDCVINNVPEPFKNTVLIVDEVDDIIVDESPNRSYATNDREEPLFKRFCNLFKRQGLDLNVIPVDQRNSFAAQQAFYAGLMAQNLVEGVNYVRRADGVFLLDDTGNAINAYDYGIEYLKDEPKLKSNYYYQSIPYMFSQYECITGFSGSLGSPSERAFLKRQYQAWCFDTPSFLNTCRNVHKVPPALIEEPDNTARIGTPCVFVYPNRNEQMHKIAILAAAKYTKVPVLIICKTPQEAIELKPIIESYIAAAPHTECECERAIPAGMQSSEFTQLFLRNKIDSVELDSANWATIVTNTTTKIRDRYRITITEPFGGRGHDFDVHDDDVDSNGGLCVIATSIPPSEREWIQWLGRTARRDNKGQYGVVLCAADEPIHSSPQCLEQPGMKAPEDEGTARYAEALIAKLFELRDSEQNRKLISNELVINSGRRLNRLCDQFYSVYDSPLDERNWPNPNDGGQVALRNLLTDDSRSGEDISRIFEELELSEEDLSNMHTFADIDWSDDSDEDSEGIDEQSECESEASEEDDERLIESLLTHNQPRHVDRNIHLNTNIVESVFAMNNMQEYDENSESIFRNTVTTTNNQSSHRLDSFAPRNPLSDRRSSFVRSRDEVHQGTNLESFPSGLNLSFHSNPFTDPFADTTLNTVTEINPERNQIQRNNANRPGEFVEINPLAFRIPPPQPPVRSSNNNNYLNDSKESMPPLIPESLDLPLPGLLYSTVFPEAKDILDETVADEAIRVGEQTQNDNAIDVPDLYDLYGPGEAENNLDDAKPIRGITRHASSSRERVEELKEVGVDLKGRRAFFEQMQNKVKNTIPTPTRNPDNNQTEIVAESKGKKKNKAKKAQKDSETKQAEDKQTPNNRKAPMKAEEKKASTITNAGQNKVVSGSVPVVAPAKRAPKANSGQFATLARSLSATLRDDNDETVNSTGTSRGLGATHEESSTSKAISHDPSISNNTNRGVSNEQGSSATSRMMASQQNAALGSTSKTQNALRSVSSTMTATSNISELRVEEIKAVTIMPTTQMNESIGRINDGGEDLTCTIQGTDDLVLQGICTKSMRVLQLTLTVKIYEWEKQFDLSLYGQKKIKVTLHGVTLLEKEILIKPSTALLPYKGYKYGHATKGTAIDKHGQVIFSCRSDPRFQNAILPFEDISLPYTGSTVIFPTSITANCILTVTPNIAGFVGKIEKYVFFQQEKRDDDVQVMLPPKDMNEGEWRVVLRWGESPRDLDLYALTNFKPKKVYFADKNTGGRTDNSRGKIELDVDVRSGNGPETVTFSPFPNKKYRFVVHKYSSDSTLFWNSNASINIHYVDDNNEYQNMVINIPTTPMYDSSRQEARYWHVFDLMEGDLQVVNELVTRDIRDDLVR